MAQRRGSQLPDAGALDGDERVIVIDDPDGSPTSKTTSVQDIADLGGGGSSGDGANLSDATPQAPGTASPGSSDEASRADHVHPKQAIADEDIPASIARDSELGVTVEDEGSALSTRARTLNFTGAGVTASGTGDEKTIDIPGGGGSQRSRQDTVDLMVGDTGGDIDFSRDGSGDSSDLRGTLRAGSVGSSEIASNAVTGGKIAGNAVTTGKINNGAVSSAKIADNAVTNAKLADDAVDSDEIKEGAVDLAHLSASGTKDATTFLRGDNSFAAPPSGGGGLDSVAVTDLDGIASVSSGDRGKVVHVKSDDQTDFELKDREPRLYHGSGEPVNSEPSGSQADDYYLRTSDNTLYVQASDGAWGQPIATLGGSGSGISGITVEDEGSALSTPATTLDFTGAGVTVTGSGAEKTVNIPGGGGSAQALSISQVGSTITAIGATGNIWDDLEDLVLVECSGRSNDSDQYDTRSVLAPKTDLDHGEGIGIQVGGRANAIVTAVRTAADSQTLTIGRSANAVQLQAISFYKLTGSVNGGESFAPSKANLYDAVKEIFHPATNAGVTADDTNQELDVADAAAFAGLPWSRVAPDATTPAASKRTFGGQNVFVAGAAQRVVPFANPFTSVYSLALEPGATLARLIPSPVRGRLVSIYIATASSGGSVTDLVLMYTGDHWSVLYGQTNLTGTLPAGQNAPSAQQLVSAFDPWDSAASYARDAVVTHNTRLYIKKTAPPTDGSADPQIGVEPGTDDSVWDLVGPLDIADDVVRVNAVDHETDFTYPYSSSRVQQADTSTEQERDFPIFAQIGFGSALQAGDVLVLDATFAALESGSADLQVRVQNNADANIDGAATAIAPGQRRRYIIPIRTSAPTVSTGLQAFYTSTTTNQVTFSWTIHALTVLRQATDGAVAAVTASDDYLRPRFGNEGDTDVSAGLVSKALAPAFPKEADITRNTPGSLWTSVATRLEFEQALAANDRIMLDVQVRSLDAQITHLALRMEELVNAAVATSVVNVHRSGRAWIILNVSRTGTADETYRLRFQTQCSDASSDRHADIVIHSVGLLKGSGADVSEIVAIADGWLRRGVVLEHAEGLKLFPGQVVRDGDDLFVVRTEHVATATAPGQDGANYQVLNVYRGTWTSGRNYYKGQIVTWTGLHICRQDAIGRTTGPDGDGDYWDTIGVFKGAWSDGWFEPFDGVESSGHVFLCRASVRNSGNRPEDDPTNWWRLDALTASEVRAIVGQLRARTVDDAVQIGLNTGETPAVNDYATVDLPVAGTTGTGASRSGNAGTLSRAQALALYHLIQALGGGTQVDYDLLANLPTLFDGDYNSLANLPTLFDGAYGSLSGLPTIPTLRTGAQTADLLEALTGDDRLDYSALRGAPVGATTATHRLAFDETDIPSGGLVPATYWHRTSVLASSIPVGAEVRFRWPYTWRFAPTFWHEWTGAPTEVLPERFLRSITHGSGDNQYTDPRASITASDASLTVTGTVHYHPIGRVDAPQSGPQLPPRTIEIDEIALCVDSAGNLCFYTFGQRPYVGSGSSAGRAPGFDLLVRS